MINTVCLTGRLSRDPEARTTGTGKTVVSFSIAVPKRIKPTDGSPDCDWINCVAWGNQAEFISKYLAKGRLIGIEGRLQTRKYTASDGSNREITEVVVNQVSGLDKPSVEDKPAGPEDFDMFADA